MVYKSIYGILNIVIGHGFMFTNCKSSRRGHRFLWTFQSSLGERIDWNLASLKQEWKIAHVWRLKEVMRKAVFEVCRGDCEQFDFFFVSLVIIAEYELRAICSLCICAWSSQAHSNNSFESDTGINDHSIPFYSTHIYPL